MQGLLRSELIFQKVPQQEHELRAWHFRHVNRDAGVGSQVEQLFVQLVSFGADNARDGKLQQIIERSDTIRYLKSRQKAAFRIAEHLNTLMREQV